MLIVGVDIGGTTVKTALVSVKQPKDVKSYRILKKAVTKTDRSGGRESVLRSIVEGIQKVDRKSVSLIGVGSAGDVVPDTGYITFATDALPGFTGLELKKELDARVGKRCVVINDASAATIAECMFGAAVAADSALVVTLGTGLGCSLYKKQSDGLTSKTVVNYRYGHITLYEGGRLCLCGLKGCAEQYASATAIKKNALDEGLDDNIDALFQAFQNKQPAATRAVLRFFEDFTETLRRAEQDFHPQTIVVGGGVTEASGWFEDFVCYAQKTLTAPILRAQLKNKAGILGAVYNALNGKYTGQ